MPSTLPRTTPLAASSLVAASGVVALGVAFALSPEHIEDGPVICPFRRLTSLPCPGCGLTRSWVYGAHGWWGESFSAHPFGLLLMAAVLALATVVVRARVRRIPAPDLDRLVRHPIVLTVLGAWLAFAAVRAALAVG